MRIYKPQFILAYIFFLTISAALFFVQPAMAKQKVRLESSFNISEFNSVASQYMERPTFLELVVRTKKPDQLYVLADFIRKTDSGKAMGGYEFISLSVSAVDDYITAVDTYLAWENIAIRDGDILNKQIAIAIGRKKSLKVKFSFYSGNTTSHYLTMQHCAFGTCLEPILALDIKNAKLFRETLLAWKQGDLRGLTAKELDDKYK